MHANDLIERVTAELIAAIEAGAGTWSMPWHTIATTDQPRSADHRPYRGINAWLLATVAADRGWTSGTWSTYRGWQRHSANVRRGEHATHVLLWKPTTRTTAGNLGPDADTDDQTGRRGLICRTFAVFAAEQVDGADPALTERDAERDTPGRIAEADAYFSAIGADVHVGGNRACYVPALDRIHIPTLAQFEQPALYYSTLAHEHIHYTGAPDRLARDLTGRFGSDAYAVEELIAELGAAYWCAQAALSPATRTDHAAYLAGWVRVLREYPRVLITVCARAQAALDWLNQHAGHPTTPAADHAEQPDSVAA